MVYEVLYCLVFNDEIVKVNKTYYWDNPSELLQAFIKGTTIRTFAKQPYYFFKNAELVLQFLYKTGLIRDYPVFFI